MENKWLTKSVTCATAPTYTEPLFPLANFEPKVDASFWGYMLEKSATAKRIIKAAKQLRDALNQEDFSDAVPWVYNPIDYAWKAHEEYIAKFVQGPVDVLLLGMNPGPWGMVQTGVPFGEVEAVKGWLGIQASAKKPPHEHPKRLIEGLECKKSEVSGRRLWGLFQSRFEKPADFFRNHFVSNYCPLAFMEESARNVTPDKLPASCRIKIEQSCDRHLRDIISALDPKWVVGIGGFAEECLQRCLPKDSQIQVGRILHPSPASPAANRDWAGTATKQLIELGIWKS